jgi:O-succinylbenzoate synthase
MRRIVFQTALTVPFRGLTSRDGMLIEGKTGWGEFSPFWDYDDAAAVPWLRSALEAAEIGWPTPVRSAIPVNVTIPAVDPNRVTKLMSSSGGCRTAKVKVGQITDGSMEPLEKEVSRIAAVRAAFDAEPCKPKGKIRIDVNGAWSVEQAAQRLRELDDVAGGLEYVEQPCRTVEELAELRKRLSRAGIDIPIAADESIRRASDPYRVKELDAADIVVLKVAPLGGVQACLELAEKIGLPVVVSSALESSIGLAAGLALAGVLPELPFACGLATSSLLVRDTVKHRLLPINGELPVLRADDPRLVPTASTVIANSGSELARFWSLRFEKLVEI